MGRVAAQVLVAAVLMAQVTVVAVLVPASRVTKTIKVIRVVTINNPVRGSAAAAVWISKSSKAAE